MTDIASIKILLSAVFIFIGIIVFYISSLISGHNIYKDIEFQHSFMVSVTIGFTLFFLLPIGFIVFLPGLFASVPSSIDSHSFKDLKDTVLAIHRIIFQNAFWPFIMASSGLGIVIGCLTLLNARLELLSWLRKKTGLGYYLLSYDFAWDHFFTRIKLHGMVAVQLIDGSWVKGHLQNISVRKEPRQIVLANYDISPPILDKNKLHEWLEGKASSDDCSPIELPYPGQILITEFDEARKIAIHGNAIKKHSHELSHAAQSFYGALLSIGFLLLLISVHCTRDFLLVPQPPWLKSQFNYLANFYLVVLMIFFILVSTSLIFSILIVKKDHEKLLSALILNPFVTFLCTVTGISTLKIAFPIIIDYLPYKSFIYLNSSWEIHTLVLLAFVLLYGHCVLLPAYKIKKAFKELYDGKTNEKKYLTKIMTYLCDEMDLNNPDRQSEYKRLKALLFKELATKKNFNNLLHLWNSNENEVGFNALASEIFKKINDLSEKYFANNGQLSLVIKLKTYCQLWDED